MAMALALAEKKREIEQMKEMEMYPIIDGQFIGDCPNEKGTSTLTAVASTSSGPYGTNIQA